MRGERKVVGRAVACVWHRRQAAARNKLSHRRNNRLTGSAKDRGPQHQRLSRAQYFVVVRQDAAVFARRDVIAFSLSFCFAIADRVCQGQERQ